MATVNRWVLVDTEGIEGDYEYTDYQEAHKHWQDGCRICAGC